MSVHADRLVEDALAVMRTLGAVIVDPAELPPASKVAESEFEVLLFEFKADLDAYLASPGRKAPVRKLADLIAFNEAHEDREMPFFGQEIFLQAEKKGPLGDPKYRAALANGRHWTRTMGIDAVMAQHKLDAFVAPTSGPASLTDLVNGDYGPNGCSTIPAVAGYPHVTLPAGLVFGLPVGLSFFGRAFIEPKLLGYAFAFEQATKHRKAPRFAPTADVS
jgi:amidase